MRKLWIFLRAGSARFQFGTDWPAVNERPMGVPDYPPVQISIYLAVPSPPAFMRGVAEQGEAGGSPNKSMNKMDSWQAPPVKNQRFLPAPS